MKREIETFRWFGAEVEYRVSRGDGRAVVIMHGGHMHAAIELGEDVYRQLGYTVIVPSRPGYGSTSANVGGARGGFADAVAGLVDQLGCTEVSAVVGISAGGPTAVEMAARHPDLVRRLVLENSVSSLPWPDRFTRVAGGLLFAPPAEGAVWAATRLFLRRAPNLGLLALMAPLTDRSTRQVIAEFDENERAAVIDLFSQMSSGRGFQIDLASAMPSTLVASALQPALVIASRHDGSVGLEHAEDLVANLPNADLMVNEASSHLMWFGPASDTIAPRLRAFLSETSAPV